MLLYHQGKSQTLSNVKTLLYSIFENSGSIHFSSILYQMEN